MVDGAKFKSHASGSHFKKSTFKTGYEEKIKSLCNWIQAVSKIEHVVTTYVYISNGVKISTVLKKNRGKRLKLSSASLNNWYICHITF